MKLYYIAVAQSGKRVNGFIEASDKTKAATYLRDRLLIPIRIEYYQVKSYLPVIPGIHKISNNNVVFFTRQLSTMLASGLNLTQSLIILKNQIKNQNMISMIDGIISAIEEGKTFSESLSLYPFVFSPVYIALIRASESGGLLDKVMLRLAESLEKSEALKSKIKQALIYPLIVVVLMGVVVLIMMVFVIPQLSILYISMAIQMPLSTQIMMASSNFITKYFLEIVIVCAIALIYFNKWKESVSGKNILDNFILRIPVFGKLIKYSLLTEFTKTLGLLVGTGALVIDALSKSAEVMGNVVYKRAVIKVAESVEKGVTIGDAMNYNPIFPPILVEMVKVGEQTGKLDESLMRVSEYFEREDEQLVKILTTAMEPFIMIILAIGVGFLIISIITPIYNLLSAFS
jgi:type IV pilus assembly protein PilC